MHLSHRHSLRLLLDSRFRKRSSTSAKRSLGGTSFANSPSMASKSISASLKRFRRHRPSPRCFQNPQIKPGFCHWPDSPVNSAIRTAIYKCAATFQGRTKFPLISHNAVYILSRNIRESISHLHTAAQNVHVKTQAKLPNLAPFFLSYSSGQALQTCPGCNSNREKRPCAIFP